MVMMVSEDTPHGISHTANSHSEGAVAAPRQETANAAQPMKM